MSGLQDRCNKPAEKLKDLQEQKYRIEADAIMNLGVFDTTLEFEYRIWQMKYLLHLARPF